MNWFQKTFPFLFDQWQPSYAAGEYALAKTAELERHIGKSTMVVKILEREKKTSKHYYRVIANDVPGLTDAKNNPIDFYIHEKNIIGPVVNANP